MKKYINASVGGDAYPILIGCGVLEELSDYLSSSKCVAIVCDKYFELSLSSPIASTSILADYPVFYLDGGIDAKGLEAVQAIVDWLFSLSFPRDGLLVAIGGGVIGDLVGFVASTYMRGISLVHVPTTTTAMIDSSVGGKTGINYQNQVNLLGTYYNPVATFMELAFLTSLDERDYKAGLCEALKMAFTSDSRMVATLEVNSAHIMSRDLQSLAEVVYWSVSTKLRHVSEDLKEKSIRLLLNYGHTFGQSIESYYGLSHASLRHGEAVSLGMIVAASLSDQLRASKEAAGLSSPSLLELSKSILRRFGLPRTLRELGLDEYPAPSELVDGLVNDKKRVASGSRFILLNAIGDASVSTVSDRELLLKSFQAIA